MVCQAASQTRFRALKHENGSEGEPTIIVRVIACFQPLHNCQADYFRHLLKPVTEEASFWASIPEHHITSPGHPFAWMVKANRSWPCPRHVAWQLPYLNCFRTPPEPRLPVYQNASTCLFPAYCACPGFTVPAIPIPKTGQTDEVQYPNLQLFLEETHTGGAMQNADPSSFQKRLLIFDHSGNKTRLFYCPVFPFDQSPVSTATKFTQACHDVNEGWEINMDQSRSTKYNLPEKYDGNHAVKEESEMHEDTEEINALLYSDDDDDDDDDDCIDDDDEVTSTGHYPLQNERISPKQESSEDMEEEIASSDRPLKKQKLNDGGYGRSSPTDNVSSVRLNETCEYVSDAESNYVSDRMFSAGKTLQEENSMAGDIQMKKDKIRESLRVLENLIPGGKAKQPLLVIDGTTEYLKSLMSQTGALGVKYR